MKTKTLYVEQYVDCEYDIEFEDVLELIESCNDKEKRKIRDLVSSTSADNLYDEQKMKLTYLDY